MSAIEALAVGGQTASRSAYARTRLTKRATQPMTGLATFIRRWMGTHTRQFLPSASCMRPDRLSVLCAAATHASRFTGSGITLFEPVGLVKKGAGRRVGTTYPGCVSQMRLLGGIEWEGLTVRLRR
jgi:hypothetical protein